MAKAAVPVAGPGIAAAFRLTKDLTAASSTETNVCIGAPGASRGGGIQLSGTFVGTVLFEQSQDGGATWVAKTVYPAAGGAGVTSATATGNWKFACGGETHFRARCSAYTSGTITVDMEFTAGVDTAVVPTATATVSGGTTDVLIGAVNETAPATDTASSGLNGRLQRIAQRITTTIANMGDVADAAWTSGSGSMIALLKAIAGAAISTNPVQTYRSDTYVSLTNTTTVKSGAGSLERIIVGAIGTSITINVYDNTAASGTLIFGPHVLLATDIMEFGCAFATGLTVSFSATTGTPNLTVVYR